MAKTEHYPSQVFWSDEDEGFIALAPDLPGCSAFGETQGEAIAELQDAIAASIGAARAAGNPVPEPSNLPTPAAYSGKVLLRMPKALHAKLAASAEREDVSLNHYMVYLLTNADAIASYGHMGAFSGVGAFSQGGTVTVGIGSAVIGYYPQGTINLERVFTGHELVTARPSTRFMETGRNILYQIPQVHPQNIDSETQAANG
jgi:predicted RNase H-like HicB family nuclease